MALDVKPYGSGDIYPGDTVAVIWTAGQNCTVETWSAYSPPPQFDSTAFNPNPDNVPYGSGLQAPPQTTELIQIDPQIGPLPASLPLGAEETFSGDSALPTPMPPQTPQPCANAPQDFTGYSIYVVAPASPNPGIDEMYVTQVAQFSKYTAPTQNKVDLVAQRQAEIRVFAKTASGGPALYPAPSVRIKLDGQPLADLTPPPAFATGLPTTLGTADELNTGHSYNKLISAASMTAGSHSFAAVVLDNTGSETSYSMISSVNVVAVNPLVVNLVPIALAGNVGSTANIGTDQSTKFWPFPSTSYVSQPNLPITTLSTADPSTNDASVINELNKLGHKQQYAGFVYGLLPQPPANVVLDCGAAFEETSNGGTDRSAFGADNNAYGAICPSTVGDEHHILPHELAHAFGLAHAPCGAPNGVDPWFANNDANGYALSDGWDFSNNSVPDGGKLYDVMSYCTSYWVGAYDWSKVLNFFKRGPTPNATLAPDARAAAAEAVPELQPIPADQQVLHVFTNITPKSLTVSGSWTDFGSIFHKIFPGPVIFEGFDAAGNRLFSATSEFSAISEGRGNYGAGDLDLPLPDATIDRLQRIRVAYNGLSAVREALPPSVPMATAVLVDSQHIRLNFDPQHFGEITLYWSPNKLDWGASIPSDGLKNSSVVIFDEHTDRDLYVDFTDGIKTVARRIRVPIQRP